MRTLEILLFVFLALFLDQVQVLVVSEQLKKFMQKMRELRLRFTPR